MSEVSELERSLRAAVDSDRMGVGPEEHPPRLAQARDWTAGRLASEESG